MTDSDSLSGALKKVDETLDKKLQVIDSLDILAKNWGDSDGFAGKEVIAMRQMLEHDINFLKEIRKLIETDQNPKNPT